jgi:hypothetical protein
MICPNCGQNSDYPRVCPNCGHVKSNPGNRAAALAVLIFLVVPCAGVGACTVLSGLSAPNQDARFYAWAFGGPIVLGCVLACIGLFFWMRKLWRG